jgi:anti-anti-sigma factor
MIIRERKWGSVRVLLLDGHLTLGDGDRALDSRVESCLDAGDCRLVLDLSGIDYLDAAGLGELVRCHRKITAGGGRMVLLGARGKVREVLELSALESRLEHASTLPEALRRLRDQRGPLPFGARTTTQVA